MADDQAIPPVVIEVQQATLIEAYKRVLLYQFCGLFALVVLLGALLIAAFYVDAKWQPTILLTAALAGMLGAFFSSLSRLRGSDEVALAMITPMMQKLPKGYLAIHSSVPALVGVVAAVVLYVAFAAGLLGGDLFPKLDCKKTGGKCTEFIDMLASFGPVEAKDYGKMLIWCFIAGFSERFVPDTLQSLVAKSRE